MFRRSRPQPEPAAPIDDDAAPVTVAVTDATFLDDTAGAVAVVDFWAPWCGPCRSFAPLYGAVAARRQRPDVRFGTCNIDENAETAAMVGVQSVPTVVAFDADGSEIGRAVGIPRPSDLEALIDLAEQARATDRPG